MPTPDIHFRPIKKHDLAFLACLYASTRSEEVATTGWPEQQQREFLQSQFEAQHKFYMEQFEDAQFDLILSGKQAIGRLYVDRRDDEIRIIDIAFLPEYRGQGIGGKLMQDLLDEAAAKSLPVRIHVERYNPALRLYRRLGFKHIDDQGVYYLMESPAAK